MSSFVSELSNKICDIHNISEKAQREEIEYGLEVVLSTVLSVVAALAVAFFCGMLKECVAFLTVFMLLRTYTGGYHAPTHVRCFFTLLIDMLFGVLIMHFCERCMYTTSWAMIAVAAVIVVVFSPIVHRNHPMSKRQRIMSRKKSMNVENGREYMLFINGPASDEYIYTIEYPEDTFTVVDTCAMTVEENGIGNINGTDIVVLESDNNGVSFKTIEMPPESGVLTKTVNAVILKATSPGQRTITYAMTIDEEESG